MREEAEKEGGSSQLRGATVEKMGGGMGWGQLKTRLLRGLYYMYLLTSPRLQRCQCQPRGRFASTRKERVSGLSHTQTGNLGE